MLTALLSGNTTYPQEERTNAILLYFTDFKSLVCFRQPPQNAFEEEVIIASRVSLLPAFRTSVMCCSIYRWDRISVVPKATDYFTSCPSPWVTHPWKSLQMSFSRGDQRHSPPRYACLPIFAYYIWLFHTVSWRPPTPASWTSPRWMGKRTLFSNAASQSAMYWLPASFLKLWPNRRGEETYCIPLHIMDKVMME